MRELDAYLQNGDHPRWLRKDSRSLALHSQTWRGIEWRHAITVNGGAAGEACILLVTGGEPNDLDEAESELLSKHSGLPVATLYHMPNQPLFEDLWEDDLIAFTFVQYLATNEPDWPLHLPMVKAVIGAMDALEDSFGFRRFVVTGISKRGWTSWLVGAARDPRVIGIAPMSIDNLNIPRQMQHELATWGEHSEQIRAYLDLDLPQKLDSPEGLHLNSIVDAYAYRDRIKCPILIVTGTNDPYWQVDAMGLYWNELPSPKYARVIPNAEHLLDKIEKNKVLAAFARSLADGVQIQPPIFTWEHGERKTVLRTAMADHCIRLWAAYSFDYEFRDKEWSVASEAHGDVVLDLPDRGLVAILAEWRLSYLGLDYSLTTPVEVLSRSGPPQPN